MKDAAVAATDKRFIKSLEFKLQGKVAKWLTNRDGLHILLSRYIIEEKALSEKSTFSKWQQRGTVVG